MTERSIYLNTQPLDEALAAARRDLNRKAIMAPVTIPAQDAVGRVTAAPVFAKLSSPTFHSAAMDGIAVRAESTFSARSGSPTTLTRGADFEFVNTGAPLPPGMNAVIMIEHVEQVNANTVRIEAPAFPWRHVRRIGEDIVATELLLPQNHPVTAYDVGALLSAGIWELKVWEPIRITIIPTGDEVLDFHARPVPGPGQVVESNSQILTSLAKTWTWGVDVTRTPPMSDDVDQLARAVEGALDGGAHIVALGAGTSAGSRDYTKTVIKRVGTLAVHGIRVMPGKPTAIGHARGRLLVGVPGYPVSATVCYEDVIAPLAAWLARTHPPQRSREWVRLARRTPSTLGTEERIRLAVGRVGSALTALPLGRGAGMITSLTRAQAISNVAEHVEGVEEGDFVKAELLGASDALDRVLVHVGSHDNTLDRIANRLMAADPPLRLASSHAGSMGGLAALRTEAALFAGCHLFDPETEDFNFPFLQRHLPGLDLTVVNLAVRQQGLLVAPGNPKAITGVHDLAREDVRFVNRQRGAGTRILLDHHLGQAGILPEEVFGYADEEFTHMAVAANVVTGAADCGLGIMAAANALSLDFVPVARERYDLIIPSEHMEDPRITALLDIVNDPDFQQEIKAMGGYDTQLAGQMMRAGMGLATQDRQKF